MPLSIPGPRDEIVQHLPRLRAFALGLTRNPDRADDLVQDTVEKAWRYFGSYTPGTNLNGWLCTILRNTYCSNLRKSWREVQDSDGHFVGQLSVPPAHDGVLAMREFMVVFDTMTAEHRDVVSLVGVLGFSYDEAAAMLGLPIGTVKSRVSRARALLAGRLHLDGGEAPQPLPGNPALSSAPVASQVLEGVA